MAWKIPKRMDTVRRRIEEYENYLRYEKRRFGGYDDGGGVRYLIGPYYVLVGDVEGALKHYKWFDRAFSDDCGDPLQYLCWTLALYRSGDLKKAYVKFLQTLFMNPFVVAKVLGIDYVLPYEPHSNDVTKEWADDIPDEFYALWDGEAKRWFKESFENPKTRELLDRYNELEKRLETEPVGFTRRRIVEDLHDLKDRRNVGILRDGKSGKKGMAKVAKFRCDPI
ncbi:MAG TPA: hypothetical protein PLV42_12515 [bacterium]|nr:hypothetical protein [bacterium]